MDFLDYMQLSTGQKILYRIKTFFTNIPSNLVKFFTLVGQKIIKIISVIVNGFAFYGRTFVKGGIGVKLSYIIMGAGNIFKGQILKGLLYLAIEALYFAYLIGFAGQYVSKFLTLGTEGPVTVVDPSGWGTQIIPRDISMDILLVSVMTFIITIAFFVFYIMNIKSAWNVEQTIKAGKKPISFKKEALMFLDERFHITLLGLPIALIICFTILPIIFTVFIAFTNYDNLHQKPNLFGWVGFQNFADVFYNNPEKSHTFAKILEWTFVWAVFATFTNYIFGMILALLINKKGIKFKAMWRTLFVITIAVPNFVTLLVMRQLLADAGTLNLALQNWGLIGDDPIPFLTNATYARIVVIVVNMWIGIPYTMLITSGILMNIPEDLYESAKIDGANAFQTFMKITLPYMLFVTTPYLISTFVGNINNFNVIFLLTGGEPKSSDYYSGAGKTDLLVTWLYKLTATNQDYNLAAVIGIIIFVICAIAALITYNMSKSAKDEEAFG